jgi:phosphoribosylanthranilate isomerase
MALKFKICGMRQPENMAAVAALNPDYLGFIFYRASARYVGELDVRAMQAIPANIRKTGVFVDATADEIAQAIAVYDLAALQLHGQEDADFVQSLKIAHPQVEVIKAFGIHEDFDFNTLNVYATVVDYFLFDTQTAGHGGSGKQFDWKLLQGYTLTLPYFLSGGIGLESLEALQQIKDPRLYAIDVNSKFETAAAMKNVAQLKEFKNQLFPGSLGTGN